MTKIATGYAGNRRLEVASFGGAPFQQTWSDLPLWEHFFNTYPIKALVELGTGQGGMALFFAAQARMRGLIYSSFDRERLYDARTQDALVALGAILHRADIFEQPHIAKSVLADQPRPLLLFCDNGNKPREFQTFVPSLRSGDFVAVHDWNAEIRIDDIRPTLPMILQEECESTDSITRFFSVP